MAFWWVSGLLLSAILWKGRGVSVYLQVSLALFLIAALLFVFWGEFTAYQSLQE